MSNEMGASRPILRLPAVTAPRAIWEMEGEARRFGQPMRQVLIRWERGSAAKRRLLASARRQWDMDAWLAKWS